MEELFAGLTLLSIIGIILALIIPIAIIGIWTEAARKAIERNKKLLINEFIYMESNIEEIKALIRNNNQMLFENTNSNKFL